MSLSCNADWVYRTLLHPSIVFFRKNRNLHYTLKRANLIRITQVGIICRSHQMYEDMPCFLPTIQQQIWLHYQSTGNYYFSGDAGRKVR
nr:MAG TPA: hypothetical protein [Caudoviricetes sp.]